MIPGDDDDRSVFPRKLFDGVKKDLLRFGRRKIGVEYIPRDEHDGDVLLPADGDELFECLDLFGQAVPVHEPLADMPIRCVENVHP